MSKFKMIILAAVAVALLFVGGCRNDDAGIFILGKYLYVNNDATINSITVFTIDSDGTLTELAGSPFITGGAGAGGYFAANRIAIARFKGLLFASNVLSNTVSVFRIKPVNGRIALAGLPVDSGGDMGGGGSLAVDSAGRYLFVGNDGSGEVSVFSIAADGTLTPVAGSPFAVGTSANGMSISFSNDFLYVADANANTFVVHAVADDGSLSPVAGSPFAYTAGEGLTSFAFCSSTLGIAGATGSIISSYAIDTDGAPTLLAALDLGDDNNQAVSTTREGSLAILSGGFSSTIGVVTVAADGTLAQVAGSPFATTGQTRGYAMANPQGTFLYASESDQVEAFAIAEDGVLTSLGIFAIQNAGDPRSRSLAIY